MRCKYFALDYSSTYVCTFWRIFSDEQIAYSLCAIQLVGPWFKFVIYPENRYDVASHHGS